MSRKSSPNDLNFWIGLGNERGYAGEFATRNTKGVTETVEWSIVREFAKAIRPAFGVSLDNVASNPNDPPDCFADIDDKRVQIELVELVDGDALREAKKTGRTPYNSDEQFLATQWDAGRFVTEVDALIDKKQSKYRINDRPFDCLLIYTAEPWLSPNEVHDWLGKTEFKHRGSFRSVYILMTHDPLYSQEHWPVFNLYGDLRND